MTIPRLAIALPLFVLAACSSRELYQTGQGWQKQECQKLADIAERQRCEKSAALSYERYKAEADAAKNDAKR